MKYIIPTLLLLMSQHTNAEPTVYHKNALGDWTVKSQPITVVKPTTIKKNALGDLVITKPNKQPPIICRKNALKDYVCQ